MITEETLHSVLMCSWDKDTLRPQDRDKWNEYVPSLNQCCVTALVVQDYFGGKLLRCDMTNGDHHYFNRLPSGKEVDLSKEQFLYIDDKPLYNTKATRSRSKILSYNITRQRYEILKRRVEDKLKEIGEI